MLAGGGYRVTLALATLTAALAPAYVLRWHVGPLPTTALEAGILATLAAFVVESRLSGPAPEWRSPLAVPALLLLAAGVVSVVDAPSRTAALGLFRAYVLEPILFAGVLVTILRAPRRAHVMLAGFWAGGAVLAVANLAAVARAISSHHFSVSATPPVAIYTVSNAVALYLVPLIAVAGSLALHGSGRRLRLVAAAFAALAVVATIATLSRGGWLTLAVVAVGLALSHRRRLWLLSATAAVGLGLVAIPAIAHRLALDLRYASGDTFSGRFRLWSESLSMLRHRPLLGAGLAGFTHAMGPSLARQFQIVPIYPHNLVLNFWSETGLLGLAAFAWIFVSTGVIAWRGWRLGAASWRPLELGVSLALLAVLVHGLVDVPYFKNDLSLEFWALVAVAWAGRRWGALAGRGGRALEAETALDVRVAEPLPLRPTCVARAGPAEP